MTSIITKKDAVGYWLYAISAKYFPQTTVYLVTNGAAADDAIGKIKSTQEAEILVVGNIPIATDISSWQNSYSNFKHYTSYAPSLTGTSDQTPLLAFAKDKTNFLKPNNPQELLTLAVILQEYEEYTFSADGRLGLLPLRLWVYAETFGPYFSYEVKGLSIVDIIKTKQGTYKALANNRLLQADAIVRNRISFYLNSGLEVLYVYSDRYPSEVGADLLSASKGKAIALVISYQDQTVIHVRTKGVNAKKVASLLSDRSNGGPNVATAYMDKLFDTDLRNGLKDSLDSLQN